MSDSDNLAFLDGYLFRVMVDILRADGATASGFFEFYESRIERTRVALSEYDRMLVGYVSRRFDRARRRILHAGTGLGTLPSALAVAGYSVAAVEQDSRRFATAGRIRTALAQAWPDAAGRYALIEGAYPAIVEATRHLSSDTVLIFTNCGAAWPEALTARCIASFGSCGDILLDARLFGNVRETDGERRALIAKIEAHGLVATPISESPQGAFYYHLTHRPAPS